MNEDTVRTKRYFGTDGIRGEVGGALLNREFVRELGFALAAYLRETYPDAERHTVVVGHDTRASGPELLSMMAEGLFSSGVRVVRLGTVPTPAVPLCLEKLGGHVGVVLTASHNPASDNGIKFFSANGLKLDDEGEFYMEDHVHHGGTRPPFMRAFDFEDFDGESLYIEQRGKLLRKGSLAGWKIALDTAHGATWRTTPAVLRHLGADIVQIGEAPNGLNINSGCGSEHPARLAETVAQHGARLGIALDGDGDRLLLVDETGTVVDGDAVLALLARHALEKGELARKTLVATIQSNLGLERAIEAAGGHLVRTAVGDRYVIARLFKDSYSLGGESSGHIVFARHATTGDGLLAALKVTQVMRETGKPLSELAACYTPFPQEKANLTVREKIPFDDLPELQDAVRDLEGRLGADGRILLRYSGTEPKIRLLVEAEEAEVVREVFAGLKKAVAEALDVE